MKKSYISSVMCDMCKVVFSKRLYNEFGAKKNSKRNYCSIKCKSSDKNAISESWTKERKERLSELMKGENNPNYGNKWNDEQKQHLSLYKIEQFKDNEEYRYACGNANRGKKFSEELIEKMHGHRTPESYQHTISQETREKIGKASKGKFTDEYKLKQREIMESLGHWVPLNIKDPYKIFYNESNWIEGMVEYFDEFELECYKKYGRFGRNNPSGWVRDHIVGRQLGWKKNLPPFILRHPVNMKFISHSENVKKGFLDRKISDEINENNISLLFERILNFDKKWQEQEVCVNYILFRKEVHQ